MWRRTGTHFPIVDATVTYSTGSKAEDLCGLEPERYLVTCDHCRNVTWCVSAPTLLPHRWVRLVRRGMVRDGWRLGDDFSLCPVCAKLPPRFVE